MALKKVLNEGYNLEITSVQDCDSRDYQVNVILAENFQEVENLYRICKDLFSEEGLICKEYLGKRTIDYVEKNYDIFANIDIKEFKNITKYLDDDIEIFLLELNTYLLGYDEHVHFRLFKSMECIYVPEDIYAEIIDLNA